MTSSEIQETPWKWERANNSNGVIGAGGHITIRKRNPFPKDEVNSEKMIAKK